ncbi:MAG: HD domain-containing protein [Halobacteriota archaeon]
MSYTNAKNNPKDKFTEFVGVQRRQENNSLRYGGNLMKHKYDKKLKADLEEQIKSYIATREKEDLSEFASKSEEGLRRKQYYTEDFRAKYARDADRILHTHAYSRYIDKTQVFSLVNNDHITHRVLHVQLVSKIARTIGRALKLNEDLIEAISIGHDIGHVPFGHHGEKFLSKLCVKRRLGRFLHNVQGVQFLDKIEDCDLTLQVLDGILCHNGEIHNQSLKPNNRDKNWEEFDNEIEDIKFKGKKDCVPMTLEGCVVRFADTIAYLGRDIQDAIEIGLIDYSEVPQHCREMIGTKNDEIINSLVIDIVENSYEDCISYSTEISNSLKEYKKFNRDYIYRNEKILEERKIREMYKVLYPKFLADLKEQDKSSKSKIYEHFVGYVPLYLFSWDNVPGNDSERLLRRLMDDLDIGWVENAEIHKSDDDKYLCIFTDDYSVEIRMDKKKEKAILKISGGRTHDLIVKNENGKLIIYKNGWISKEYFDNSTPEEKVRDYIAGMTDRYFESRFKEIMLPKRITTFHEGFCSQCGVRPNRQSFIMGT